MPRLEGKTAIVTGSARGIGEATARRFVAEGANVVVSDILHDRGEAVAAELGPAAVYAPLDVAEESQWKTAVALAHERFGALDVLVNNAAVAPAAAIENVSLEEWEWVIRVNQTGVFLGIRAAAPAMRAVGGGSIINVSTAGSFAGTPGVAAYGASKWAVRSLTKTAALELGADGIRVNCVSTGSIRTPMLKDAGWNDPEQLEATAKLLPLGRIGNVEDVTGFMVYLASDESDYCTGTDFVIDGGSLAGPFPRGFAKD
jgi:3alpha(or 20beta)-hydroxysteroid dehydrogenase